MKQFAVLVMLSFVLAGCASPQGQQPVAEPPTEEAPVVAWDVLMERSRCSGYNAILFTDPEALQPFVPSNWTFTSFNGELAILRVHLVGCNEGLHLILSTPMQPDAASQEHHDNPDVVIAVYSTNMSEAAAWQQVGVNVTEAEIDWNEEATGDVAHVSAAEGDVLRLVSLDGREVPRGSYVWPAAYATGQTDVKWFWGHENATSRTATLQEAAFGAASPFPGLTTTPWSVQAWIRFNVTYAPGTPPKP